MSIHTQVQSNRPEGASSGSTAPPLKKGKRVSSPALLVSQLSAASSNESEAAVVELAAIHPTVSSVAGVADCIRVGEATTIAVV